MSKTRKALAAALILTLGACSGGGGDDTGETTDDPIVIGVSLPLTGDFSEPGKGVQQGYEAWAKIGPEFAIQGNLDPHALFAPWPEIERRAADILQRAAGRPGHIFNLGHGILTETPVENVARLAEFIHEHTSKR